MRRIIHISIFFSLLFFSCEEKFEQKLDENTDASVDPDGRLNIVNEDDHFETEEALQLNGEGISFAQNEEFDKAREKFLAALKYERKNPTILNNLGLVEKCSNNPSKAQKYFKNAISIDTTYYKAHANYGLLLFEQYDYKGSLLVLEKAIKGCTDRYLLASLYLHAAFSYHGLSKCEKARDYFEKSKDYTEDKGIFDIQNEMFEEKLSECE